MASNAHALDRNVSYEFGAQTPIRPRMWPAVAIVAGFWIYYFALQKLEMPISTTFFGMAAGALLLPLAFTIWWFASRRVALADRLKIYGAMLAMGIAAGVLIDPSIGAFGLVLFGPAAIFSAWTLWLLAAAKGSRDVQFHGLLVVFAIVWGLFLLFRIDGIDGNQQATMHLRWTPTAESVFLAERAQRESSAKEPAELLATEPVVLGQGDWPEFRGPKREGEVHGVKIATDWDAHPPKLAWRQRVGPAWSSFVVIGNRAYTQEQRGEEEATVCLDAATGKELWAHVDHARYWDGQAGAGPRSTPTFAEGLIFTLGGTGILNCLDAATGKLHWTHDVIKESAAQPQAWGLANSPLVVDGLVIVYSGGQDNNGLLAYRVEDGGAAWKAASGAISYSSPQAVTFDGQKQVVFLSEQGLVTLDPGTGAVAWKFEAPSPFIWRATQPRQIGDSQLLFGTEDLGLTLLDVERVGDKFMATEHWQSKALRPGYNDFVTCDGNIYGLDGSVAACIDLKTGKRRWKGGRYGHGQILLVADQKLLLIVSETGEVALVRAAPERHEELARMQAINGKTWNHPVIAHGRLFVRNDEEMACFELTPQE